MTSSPSQTDSGSRAQTPRLADLVGESPAERLRPRQVRGEAWIKVVVLAAAFVWLTHKHYQPIYVSWLHDTNWTHGFVIPLFSLFLLWQRRHELLAAERKPSLWGLPVMLLGMAGMIYAAAGVSTYISRMMVPVILVGLVWYVGGTQLLRYTWLPILYLVFAIPVPDILYQRVSVPLQNLAARASAAALTLAGVQIKVAQSHLTVVSGSGTVHSLMVAEACSGMRSLMAYAALAVAVAYVTDRPIWQRVVLVLCVVPVAVFLNLIRVTITCSMYAIDRPEYGQEFMHTFLGMLMLIPAGLLFWLISWVLSSLFVEEQSETPAAGGEAGSEAVRS